MKYNIDEKKLAYNKLNKYDVFFVRYFMYLYNIAITRFEWINLPEEIVPSFIEKELFWNGKLVFFKDTAIDKYAITNVNEAGQIDIYGHGDMRFAYAYNYMQEYNKSNSVLIYDNLSDYPAADFIMMHADALSNIRLSRDINVIANRTPVVIAGTSDMQLTVRNIFKKIHDAIPFLSVKDNVLDIDSIKALKTDAPILFDKLHILLKQEMSSALTFLGVYNSDTSKRERLVSGEVAANNGEIEMNRQNALFARKRACEQINRVFGLNIDVDFRSDIPLTPIEEVSDNREEEEEEGE